MINIIEILNWKTTRLLRNQLFLKPEAIEPFSTRTGLKEDK